MVELQTDSSAIRFEEHVHAAMSGSIERVIADQCVVIGVLIDPLYRLADPDGDRKWSEAIFVWHNDLAHGPGIGLSGRHVPK